MAGQTFIKVGDFRAQTNLCRLFPSLLLLMEKGKSDTGYDGAFTKPRPWPGKLLCRLPAATTYDEENEMSSLRTFLSMFSVRRT